MGKQSIFSSNHLFLNCNININVKTHGDVTPHFGNLKKTGDSHRIDQGYHNKALIKKEKNPFFIKLFNHNTFARYVAVGSDDSSVRVLRYNEATTVKIGNNLMK